jgi:glyoxylate/hydroxypyruvate reductase
MNTSYSISLCCPTIDPRPWADALAQALPEAQVNVWSAAQQSEVAQQADYAVTWAPTQSFFDAQLALKAVFALGAGVDSLLKLQIAHQIQLVRIEDGGMGKQMADYVTHALLRHYRQFDRYEAEIRQGMWPSYPALDFQDITVGIMGLGQLGSQMAQRVQALGFKAVGYSRSPKLIDGMVCYSGDEMDDFLSACDALICALPLTPDTQNLLNNRTLGLLRPGAFLVNVARGSHVVEEDLLSLLASGHLSGACLDVLRQEPAPADHPLRSHPRVMLTPHIAALTLLKPSILQISQKIRALHAGRAITGVVQRDRGY